MFRYVFIIFMVGIIIMVELKIIHTKILTNIWRKMIEFNKVLNVIKKYGNIKLGGRKLDINSIIYFYKMKHKSSCDRSDISKVLLRIKLDKSVKFQKRRGENFYVYWI